MDIILRDWQKKPIIYMTQECENNDGIFLFHYMGSGKSYTALGIVHNLGLPYLIICPDVLVSQWKNDYVIPYKKYLPKNTGVIAYRNVQTFLKEKSPQYFKTTTLIMDECHNYTDYVTKLSIEKLQNFRKRILLSGTPVYMGMSDLGYTINITAGKNIFPIDERRFEKEYYMVKKRKSIMYGWFRSNLIYARNLEYQILKTVAITSGVYTIAEGTGFLGSFIKNSEKYINMLADFVENLFNNRAKFYNNFTPLTKKLIEISLKISFIISEFVGKKLFKKSFNDAGFTETIRGLFAGKIGTLLQLSPERLIMVLGLLNYAIIFLFALTISIFLWMIYSDSSLNKGKETYLIPDYEKIRKNIGPYVSYYNPYENKNSSFPKVIETKEYESLTYSQILVLMRYTVAKMTYEDYVSLGIFENFKKCEQSKYNQKDYDLLLAYGRFIGNICYFTNEKGKYVYELKKILYYDEQKNHCSLHDNIDFYDIPLKYERILQYKKSFPKHKIVVYTSSTRSAHTLSAYLTTFGAENQLLLNSTSPNKFKTILKKYYSTSSILILDNKYFEGLSVLKTDCMFLLEAVENIAKSLQVRARVVRLDSHPPGSSVKIINLLSTMNIVKKYMGSIDSYIKNSAYLFYPDLFTYHNQHVTPDYILYGKIVNLSAETDELVNSIKRDSIQYEEPKDSCEGVDCKIAQLNEPSQCGKIISKAILKKKTTK